MWCRRSPAKADADRMRGRGADRSAYTNLLPGLSGGNRWVTASPAWDAEEAMPSPVAFPTVELSYWARRG
jgi:hypothetical protein